MPRATSFLWTYVAAVALLQAANPWAVLDQAAAGTQPLQPSGILALVLPLFLVGLAARRGREVGLPHLYAWPLAALVFSGLPFFVGWSLVLAGHAPPDWRPMPELVRNAFGMLAIGVPLLLHLACCLRGTAAPAPVQA